MPKRKQKKKVPKKKGAHVTEGGEETDEGDLESWEVDYMSDASSISEKDYKVSECSFCLLCNSSILVLCIISMQILSLKGV